MKYQEMKSWTVISNTPLKIVWLKHSATRSAVLKLRILWNTPLFKHKYPQTAAIKYSIQYSTTVCNRSTSTATTLRLLNCQKNTSLIVARQKLFLKICNTLSSSHKRNYLPVPNLWSSANKRKQALFSISNYSKANVPIHQTPQQLQTPTMVLYNMLKCLSAEI